MINNKIPIFNKNLFIEKIAERLVKEDITDIHTFTEIITLSINESTIYKNIRFRESNNWITPEILDEIKIRNKLYNKMKKLNKIEIHYQNYIKIRKQFKDKQIYIENLISVAKDNYYNKKAAAAGHNGRKIFKMINQMIYNKDSNKKKRE